MNVPLVELMVDSDDEVSGVDFVAFVDEPAIERNWMAFRATENPFQFKITDEEKRRVMGPLMVADQPIYRVDDKGKPYYAVFKAAAIENIVKKFFKNGFTANVNEMHNPKAIVKDCYMIESFIIDTDRGIKTPDGFSELPNGSWFGTYQIDNDEIWSKIKAGEFFGFSVEGMFGMSEEPDSIDMEVAQALIDALINEK